MTEIVLQWNQLLRIFMCVPFAGLYGFGGMIDKKLRRIGGALYATLAILIIGLMMDNFSYFYLLYALLLFGALSIGYGAERTGEKIRKRALFGLACSFASAPIMIINSAWIMWGFHTGLCITASTLLGTTNPITARGEESTIGFFIIFLPIMTL